MSRTELQAIEQLARLLEGDVRPEDIAPELRTLATLADRVSDEIEVARPTPAFRARLRAELVEHVAAQQTTFLQRIRGAASARTARWRYSARVAMASATASTVLGTAGVATAAQQALPDQALYPVKQLTEDARMLLASGDLETGQLELSFAQERLNELARGLGGFDADTVITTLDRMDESSVDGANALLRHYDETGEPQVLDTLAGFAQSQRAELSAVFDELPSEAVPFVDRSLELLRRIEVRVSGLSAGCPACGEDAAGAPIAPIVRPGDGPATDPLACDCVEVLPPAIHTGASEPTEAVDTGTFADPSDDGDDDGSTTTPAPPDVPDQVTITVPTLPQPLDGAARSLEDALRDLSPSTGTGEVTEEVTEPIEDHGGSVGDLLGE